MKRILATILAALAFAVSAETSAVPIYNGGAWNADACRLVAIRAASTNATSSITVKRVMNHVYEWNETVLDFSVTNSVNITTNGVGGLVTNYIIASRQVLRSASFLATNTIATLTLSGNFAVTNLPSEVALVPGDTIIADGAPMKGGKVQLLVWR